jgi:hypothetical protein
MKPVNVKERSQALLYFILLFTATVGLIAAIIFISTRVPLSENAKLRNELSRADSQREVMLAFQNEMTETVNLMKNLDARDVQPARINGQIDSKLDEMNTLIKKIPEKEKLIYVTVIENLASLKKAKNDLLNVSNSESKAGELNQELQQLKDAMIRKDAQILEQQRTIKELTQN